MTQERVRRSPVTGRTSRPNILLFISDQHSGRVLGAAGDPFVRTPHLDALAAQGVRWRRAYCGSPLCVPSRMTFLTSRHCSDIGVWTNQGVLRSEIPTFAHMLGAAGYETVLCGRMHFTCADHRHGFQHHLVGDVTSQWPGTRGPDLGPIPLSTTGQSRPAVETAGPGRTAYQSFDRAVVEAAMDYLRRHAAARPRQPFCLVVGGVLPHCPFICPRDLFREYYARVDVPRLSAQERAGLHPAVQAWRQARGVDDIPDDQVRTARAAYYGLVTLLDSLVGELVQAVADAGLEQDTAIIYTSDHGDMAGEHEMWWKSSFYEGSVGVPLIASWPSRWARGAVLEPPASLLDLAPTLTELGSAQPIPDARGRSLLTELESGQPTRDEPRDLFSENVPGKGQDPSRMIVRWPWKLVHHHGYERPQLFDLASDPDERRDLAGDPACAQVQRDLHARVLEGWHGDRVAHDAQEALHRWNVLRDWARAVQPPDPDHWREPPGCNVFPER